MDSTRRRRIAIFLLLIVGMIEVNGHGRLMDPPARNSMWRAGFPNPKNYDDNGLFCGGFTVQYAQNEGRCGICGDPYHVSEPRPHEAGGTYAKGTIVRQYVTGETIKVEVELTANHQGYFVLRLCPNNNSSKEVTQECLDRNPLYLTGTTNEKFRIPRNASKRGIFKYEVDLPPGLTCSQCVIQWDYYAANNWGTCEDGVDRQGCGKAELFRNCADVSIGTNTGSGQPSFARQNFRDDEKFISKQVCVAVNASRSLIGMDEWCQTNCFNNPSYCPPESCYCPETCDAIGEIAGQEGADVYCQDKCVVYPSVCPRKLCSCQ